MVFFLISLAVPVLLFLLFSCVGDDTNSKNDKRIENLNQLEEWSVVDNNIAVCSVGEIQPEIKEAKFVENLV